MLNDIYLMNKKTGELKPYEQVRKEFYSVPRHYLDSLFDEWEETDIIVEDSFIEFPDFTKTVNF